MKISQIALRNFRSGQNLVLDTDAPRVYVCGLNGVGKSSIKDAIRWTLRGICQTTDAKGQGWEALVPAGTTTLSAGLTVNGSTVDRSYSTNGGGRSLAFNNNPGAMTDAQNAVYDALKTTPAYLDAVLETEYFLRLHHADAKAMVLGLLNVRIPYGEESLTLEQVDARYKQAFQERAAAKTRLKSFMVPTFVAPPEGMLPRPEDVEKLLRQRRDELQALIGSSAEASGKRKALTERFNAVASVNVPEPTFDAVALTFAQTELSVLEDALKDWQQAMVQFKESIEEMSAPSISESPAGRQGLIRTLTDHQPKKGCVLDPNVPCKTAKIIFTNRVKELKASLPPDMVSEAAQPAQEALPPSFDHQALADARKRLQSLRDAENRHSQWVAAEQRRKDELDALTAQLASLPPDVEVDSTAVEAAKARVIKGEGVLKRSQDEWRAHDAYQKAKGQKEALEAEVNRLEELCQDLGPNGLRVKALGDAIGAFETAINQTTKAFGWHVSFQLEPWTCLINGRTIDAYSESEQFRIGIAVQLAVAVASGLGFLVVDRLDMLDAKNRKIVTGMVLRAEGIQQAFILATKEAESGLPSGTGLKAYRLAKTDDGKTVIQEAA